MESQGFQGFWNNTMILKTLCSLFVYLFTFWSVYAADSEAPKINKYLCNILLASDIPSEEIDFNARFKMVSDDGHPSKKGPVENFDIKQTYVNMVDTEGNIYGGIIQGVRPNNIQPGQTYDVQHYNDKKGKAVARLNSDEFAVAAYDELMQSMSHGGKEFSVSDLAFVPSEEFKNAESALVHVASLYLKALENAKRDLGNLGSDESVLAYLSNQYYEIENHYYQHFPELKALGSLKVPINENMTTSDHARDVFSNLMVMLVALDPILTRLGAFQADDVLVSLLSFGFNHDFLKAAVAAVAGRSHQDRANMPFRRLIEPSLGLNQSIVDFGIFAKWGIIGDYFTNWRTTDEDFVRDDSKTPKELLSQIKQTLLDGGINATPEMIKSYFWFSIIAEMADGTGYGLQNTYTMLILPNGGRALIPAADLLEDRAAGKVNSFFLETLKLVDPAGHQMFVDIFGVNSDGVATNAILRTSDKDSFVFNP